MTQSKTKLAGLRQQRADIESEIEKLLGELEQGEVDPSEDEGDPDVAEREKILAVVAALRSRLREVEAALAQAESGTYGHCEVCGDPIDPERLRIMPEATMCVRCKAASERRRGARPSVRFGSEER
jgi:RNA polymerase-binding transcription factor DksA